MFFPNDKYRYLRGHPGKEAKVSEKIGKYISAASLYFSIVFSPSKMFSPRCLLFSIWVNTNVSMMETLCIFYTLIDWTRDLLSEQYISCH